jgi:hypothetical protein
MVRRRAELRRGIDIDLDRAIRFRLDLVAPGLELLVDGMRRRHPGRDLHFLGLSRDLRCHHGNACQQ